MTTRTMLKLCATFESASGVALIAFPNSIVWAFFGGGLPGDVELTRGAGLAPLFLGLVCWPRGDGDVAAQILLAQFAYTLLVALYLGYLRLFGGFNSILLWPTSALHGLLALLLAGLAFERVSAAKAPRVDQR